MAQWSIRSNVEKDDETRELLYWSNHMGWVSWECADSFSDEDRACFQHIPLDSEWVVCPHDGQLRPTLR